MFIPQAIFTYLEQFLEYIEYQKRYSKHTATAYETDLQQFLMYAVAQFNIVSIDEVKTTIIRSWLASLKDEETTAKTINRKISSLKSFFKYLQKQSLIQKNPTTLIAAPKIPKRLANFVREEDIHTLLQYVEFTDDFEGKTKKLIISLFYETGIRLSELINAKESDINEAYQQIKILGKGNKERIIPIGASLLQSLKEYITLKPNNSANNIFVNAKGKPLQPRTIYGFVKENLALVTTIQKKSPHVLRHSFATHLMNNGAEINAVKELLGHSSLAATQVYTHNTIEKLKNAYKKAHPKA